ncbi:MAG: sugar phosphate isomerase/epimerase, partial [Lachnospiraceae bacterium]|nr:sugar phosphate isomerase/epimerase [Lachnospiraceae bacterium]
MGIKRAISLYSYQENFYLGKLDLEGCIAEAAKTGAKGIELIPEQNCADEYLDPSKEFVAKWKDWMQKYEVEPCAVDIFYDYKLYNNRILTWKEQVKMYTDAFRFAKKLGFPIVRGMLTTPLKLVEMMIPVAEDMGLKFGVEVHSPYSLESEYCMQLYELADKHHTKSIGVIPDTGIYVKQQSEVIVQKFIRAGAHKEIADYTCRAYVDKVPQQEAAEAISKMNPNAVDHALFKRVYFATYDDPGLLGKHADHIIHVH